MMARALLAKVVVVTTMVPATVCSRQRFSVVVVKRGKGPPLPPFHA
jgi:hypothetical protein